MKMIIKRLMSFSNILVLIAAMALCVVGCSKGAVSPDESSLSVQSNEEMVLMGSGENAFNFSVVDANGSVKKFYIRTEETVVGDALVEAGLISGEQGPYGLYVKTVNGITLDYDKDGMYWAFYENGKYGAKGVDQTDITENTEYAFKAEK